MEGEVGFVRLLLALSVVLDHSTPILGSSLVGGRTAVECFFVISGFYMAMVIERKYGRLRTGLWRTFMASRAARLYPVYVVVFLLTVVSLVARRLLGADPILLANLQVLSPLSLAALAASNITLLGQDVVQFLHVSASGDLDLIGRVTADANAHEFMVVPQAWTLSLELLFYACAPFLLRRRTPVLVAVLALSVGARIVFVRNGLDADPWSYRCFPLELSFFVAGALSYRWGRRIRPELATRIGPALLALTALCFVVYSTRVTSDWTWLALVFPYAFAPVVPVLFAWTSSSSRDRWVGELSYPLYLVHVLLADLLRAAGFTVTGLLLTFVALPAAVALLVVVDGPVERWRQRRLSTVLAAGVDVRPSPSGA